jgi:hypothetical protein
MNDRMREQWVDNDEGLYVWWQASRLGKRMFIRQYRRAIDVVIDNIIEGRKPAHYFKYERTSGAALGVLQQTYTPEWAAKIEAIAEGEEFAL